MDIFSVPIGAQAPPAPTRQASSSTPTPSREKVSFRKALEDRADEIDAKEKPDRDEKEGENQPVVPVGVTQPTQQQPIVVQVDENVAAETTEGEIALQAALLAGANGEAQAVVVAGKATPADVDAAKNTDFANALAALDQAQESEEAQTVPVLQGSQSQAAEEDLNAFQQEDSSTGKDSFADLLTNKHQATQTIVPSTTNATGSIGQAAFSTELARMAETHGSSVVNQVADHLKSMVQSKDGRSLHLELNPAELGRVELHLVQNGKGLDITLVTEQPLTGKLLESQLTDLKQILVDNGVQLSNLNVSQQDQQQNANQAFNSHQKRHTPGLAGLEAEADTDQLISQTYTLGNLSGIDYRV